LTKKGLYCTESAKIKSNTPAKPNMHQITYPPEQQKASRKTKFPGQVAFIGAVRLKKAIQRAESVTFFVVPIGSACSGVLASSDTF
jgi:hypothetical protein